MNTVIFDGLGYDIITNNPKNLSDLKQVRLYFAHATCPSGIKRATLFIGVCLEPRLRPIMDQKVKTGRVIYWIIIVLEARSDTDLFRCHFPGQYTFSWPNLTSERLGQCHPTSTPAERNFFLELTILISYSNDDHRFAFILLYLFLFPPKIHFQVLACLQMLTGMQLFSFFGNIAPGKISCTNNTRNLQHISRQCLRVSRCKF